MQRKADREGAKVSCDSCHACCCRLEVILMAEDDVPGQLVETNRWGGEVMARLADGWCAALDRGSMLCRIYQRRPAICREFAVGSSECLTERLAMKAVAPTEC
ncbi:MAG: Fe-S-oxidoreductase [Betaproteobacteria bacterium SG8_40]|nr:MAG: Fe-S-oxidoreductase [Betaproteobacteria bacterium SG8_40]